MDVKAGRMHGRRLATRNLVALLVPALLICLALLFLRPRGAIPAARFLAIKGGLAGAELLERTTAGGTVTEELRLTNGDGLVIRALVQAPDTSGVRLPAFVVQGGYRTGRNAIRYLPKEDHPAVLLALDYPYTLPDDDDALSLVLEVPRMLEASERTVAGMLLALDYLESRPDVDPHRTVVVGGSLGGLFAVIAGAVEPRFDAVILLYGGGNLPAILDLHLPIESQTTRRLVIRALEPWVGRYDPLHYVSRIAPRPFLMVNGRGDGMIPDACALVLHEAAGEGKDLVWLETRHGIIRDGELLGQVGGVVFGWLQSNGLLDR